MPVGFPIVGRLSGTTVARSALHFGAPETFFGPRAISEHSLEAGHVIAFPTPIEIAGPFVELLVGAVIVYFVSRMLKLRPPALVLASSRRDLTHVLLVILATFALVVVYRVIFHMFVVPALGWEAIHPTLDAVSFALDVVLAAVIVAPLLALRGRTGLSWGSIGVRRADMGKMLILGVVPSGVLVAVVALLAPQGGLRFAGFSPGQAYAVVAFLLLAAAEEVVYRGYVQTRLVAKAGVVRGWVVTALVFSLAHFPVRFFAFGGVVADAFVSTLLVFPLGLLFGFFMLRSQNVVPGTIFHAVSNLISIFFQAGAL